MISIKYNAIKSYYAKSAMREKKVKQKVVFQTQELSETFNFNYLARGGRIIPPHIKNVVTFELLTSNF